MSETKEEMGLRLGKAVNLQLGMHQFSKKHRKQSNKTEGKPCEIANWV